MPVFFHGLHIFLRILSTSYRFILILYSYILSAIFFLYRINDILFKSIPESEYNCKLHKFDLFLAYYLCIHAKLIHSHTFDIPLHQIISPDISGYNEISINFNTISNRVLNQNLLSSLCYIVFENIYTLVTTSQTSMTS